MPAYAAGFEWGKQLTGLTTKDEWKKSLKKTLTGLDEAEFDVFLAQLVIKASGKGVVGKELTAIVEIFRQIRG